jgi:hypothetical protein
MMHISLGFRGQSSACLFSWGQKGNVFDQTVWHLCQLLRDHNSSTGNGHEGVITAVSIVKKKFDSTVSKY